MDEARRSSVAHYFSLPLFSCCILRLTNKCHGGMPNTKMKVGLDRGDSPGNSFYCSTCPYTCSMVGQPPWTVQTITSSSQIKQVDDILGGAAAWANVDRTMTVCPSCNHNEAYFLQMQIRSADEPMSIFYKCTKCNHQWNDK